MDPRIVATLKKISLPLIMIIVAAYFLYHIMEGRYGIRSWRVLKVQHHELQQRTQALESTSTMLEDKVKRLSPSTLDLDYVEELIHEKMGVFHHNDLIVHVEAPKPASPPKP